MGANAAIKGRAVSAYPQRRSRKRWIVLVAIILLVVGGVFLWRYLSGFESTDDAQVDVHLYPVSARISGYIDRVNVNDNEWVESGSTLVEIDPKDYEVALARTQATLETSEAVAKGSNIDVPVSSVDTSSQLKFASSDIDNAEAAIQAAEKQAAAAHARVVEAQAENVKAQDDVIAISLAPRERGGAEAGIRPCLCRRGNGCCRHRCSRSRRGRGATDRSRSAQPPHGS